MRNLFIGLSAFLEPFHWLKGAVILLFFFTSFFPVQLWGQQKLVFSGIVKDENHQPLPGATVRILPARFQVATDDRGHFRIEKLDSGNYVVEIAFVGFERLTDTLAIGRSLTREFQLTPRVQTLQEVRVTDHYAEYRKREETLNAEVVNDDYLRQHLGGSLVESLERLPGVTAQKIGSGQSKPVIRGLGFNRVVVLENGIKHEAQQWGADHGLEVDQFSYDRMEVLKGPASLMVGSDALGGVIHLQNISSPPRNSFQGSIDLVGKSGNHFLGSSMKFSVRRKDFFVRLRGTLLDYADFRVPADSIDIYSFRAPLHKQRLRNTAGKEQNLHFAAGILKSKFKSWLFLSNVNSKSGFFANAHGLEPRQVDTGLHDESERDIHFPYQQVNHLKIISKNDWNSHSWRIQSEMGYQHNFRQEWSSYVNHGFMPATFPENMPFPADLEREFDKEIYSANVRATFHKKEGITWTGGVSSQFQDNDISGRGFIVPEFNRFSGGAFLLADITLSARSHLKTGLRYDYGKVKTNAYFDWFPTPFETSEGINDRYLRRSQNLEKHFSNWSWSVGYILNTDNLMVKVNAGKGFRMPSPKELAANGVNYHHFSYEKGDPGLSPEVSYQVDAGLEWKNQRFAMGITPFLNFFSGYIYLNPLAEHDRLYGSGHQIFEYTQSNVSRYGGELHAHYDVVSALRAGVIVDYVYSLQLSGDKEGFTLPFSPPPSVVLNLKYQPTVRGAFANSYLSVDLNWVASQNNIVPPEKITPGYRIINLGLGGEMHIQKQPVSWSFQVRNLLNKTYFNHTSYYRLINVPEPARNMVLNVTVPFTVILKPENVLKQR